MNIFYLDPDPEVAARYHCDKHCVKMILESAQLLSTAHRVLDGDEFADEQGIYKAFSPNHPSAIWTRESCENYDYVWDLTYYLCKEFTKRYTGVHGVQKNNVLTGLAIYPHNLLMKSFTPPPQCMPDEYKVEGDPVQAYKNYYHGEKAYFAEWRLGAPLWWKGE
tara:strand:- start:111 stop:602 length:492 start_codon:yes stop_codon:yes gene_type:complete